ncbi:MAG TPA: hypothetical protein VJ180_00760 [Pyrinomonadaceae bacterium]|nr:hypothetical protein [Pyrinomonadaceae bacterium]
MSTKVPEALLQQLRDLRRGLLHLHKILLNQERADYEKARGSVSSGELLQLVINHEQFAWLHSISELIVQIDEALDADMPITSDEAKSLLGQARKLLNPSEFGNTFEQRYHSALQRESAAVLAHREVTRILSSNDLGLKST